jgi:hypothetical protein
MSIRSSHEKTYFVPNSTQKLIINSTQKLSDIVADYKQYLPKLGNISYKVLNGSDKLAYFNTQNNTLFVENYICQKTSPRSLEWLVLHEFGHVHYEHYKNPIYRQPKFSILEDKFDADLWASKIQICKRGKNFGIEFLKELAILVNRKLEDECHTRIVNRSNKEVKLTFLDRINNINNNQSYLYSRS